MTCAFKPGCLISHKWLHTSNCEVQKKETNSNMIRTKKANDEGHELLLSYRVQNIYIDIRSIVSPHILVI